LAALEPSETSAKIPHSAVLTTCLGLRARHLQGPDRPAGLDPLVHRVLDAAQLIGSEGLAVREVEAQLVRANG
jgi:hypothetical protein